MKTTAIGKIGEDFAVKVLQDEGYNILERNCKCANCEVDIVCDCYLDKNGNLIKQKSNFLKKLLAKLHVKCKPRGERLIVFVEVKSRFDDAFGDARESVTPYKVGRYVTAAKGYLKYHRLEDVKVRFDVFAVSRDEYEHIVNAFDENDAKYSHKSY